MHPLHLSKVAVGCGDVDALRDRLMGRAAGGETWIDTRFRPTRHAELIGGSLYWIIKHRVVARSPILRFDEDEQKRCLIRLEARLVPVVTSFKRVHQGWRYYEAERAPRDLGGGDVDGLDAMPGRLVGELAALGLI